MRFAAASRRAPRAAISPSASNAAIATTKAPNSSHAACAVAPSTDLYSAALGTLSTTLHRDDGTGAETYVRRPRLPTSPRVTAASTGPSTARLAASR